MEVRINRQSRPPALAVQPVRYINHQVQILERKARQTSVCVSETSTDPAEPGPTVPTTPDDPEDHRGLHAKASSVLLGEECRQDARATSSPWSKTIREYDSSSTLRTFYEPRKAPLNVSQQTSESSARDLALRKGCQAVAPVPHRSRPSPTSTMQPNEKRTATERIDVSTLLPRPGMVYVPMLPQDEPAVQPRRSKYFSIGLSPTSKLHRTRYETGVDAGTRNAAASKRSPQSKQPTGVSGGMSYYKTNVRKPKAGIKNWFDTFDEDISDADHNDEPELRPDFVDGLQTAFCSMSSPVTPASIPESLQAFGSTPSTGRSKSHRTRVDALGNANLREQSVLCLSSSDDEDSAPERHVPQKRRAVPTIRDSLAVDTLNDFDIEIGTAQAVSAIDSTNAATSAPHHVYRRPLATIPVPPRQSSRACSKPGYQEATVRTLRGHQKRRSTVGTTTRLATEGWLDSPAGPAPFLNSGQGATGATRAKLPHAEADYPSSPRLMTVTRQEQLLLAAMRAKRANMHTSSNGQGGRWTHEEQMMHATQSSHRPHTSSANVGAPAFVEVDSNNHVDWIRRRRSSLIGDAQLDRDSVTTFQTASSPQRTSVRFPSLPSSGSHSHHSPTTPPSHSEPEGEWRSSTGLGTYFSLSSDDLHTHSRSRTDSSHIVVLDDLDNSPKDLRRSGLDEFTYNELRLG